MAALGQSVPVSAAPLELAGHDDKSKNLVTEAALSPRTTHEDSNDEQTEDGYGARPACFKTTVQELLFVFIATMAMAMNAILSGTTTVIPYFVALDLDMSQAQLTWFTASSSLASGAFLLFFGRIADMYGRKTMIIVSFFLFAVVTLGCGFAKSAIVLDVLNGVLGLLCASGIPPAQGSLSVVYGKPSRRKNAAFACFSAGNPVGFACGMVFAGIATQLFSWRASYWLLSIVYLVLTVAAFFCVPSDTTPKRPFNRETIKQFDIVGMLLTISGIAMFSAGLSLGSNAPEGWKTGYVIALIIVGFAIIVAFVVWESKYPYPLLPMTIWKDMNFSLLMGILLLGFMAFPPGMFFLALFFQRVWGFSALSTAVHLLPLAVMGVMVNIFAGAFMHRVNNKLLMLVGTASYTISFLLLALNRTSSSYWAFCFPAFLLCVIGADLEFNVANMYVMTSLPVDQQSIAGGILQMITRLFTTVSFGIVTAIFDAVQKNPTWGGYYRLYPATQPYSAVLWFTTAATGLSVILSLFLSIGTQGGNEKKRKTRGDGREKA
ncbi:hypothetical protein MBLNU457_7254t1 [Dothideomycetes sp. NU457]